MPINAPVDVRGFMGILIVDDSESIRMLMEVILRKTGYHQLLTAASARDAFTRLGMDGPATPDMDIDLVLLDIMMPEVDGIEACRRINAVESLRDIPIIMVSARADTKYLEAAFNAGAHDYITKPFNTLEVTARVRSALALKRETDSRIHAHAELQEKNRLLANESLAKSQILKTATHDLKTPLTGIIGYADRLLGQRANVGLLSERQQKYVEAISECSHQMSFMIDRLLDVSRIEAGNLDMTPICLEVREEIERTIQNLQTRFQEKRINVLLDVMLPMLDGFEVLAKLKRNPETEAIPIIMLTALSAEEREQDAYNSGVSHYISKPFDADTLESTIRVALREAGIEEDSDHLPKSWMGLPASRPMSLPTRILPGLPMILPQWREGVTHSDR